MRWWGVPSSAGTSPCVSAKRPRPRCSFPREAAGGGRRNITLEKWKELVPFGLFGYMRGLPPRISDTLRESCRPPSFCRARRMFGLWGSGWEKEDLNSSLGIFLSGRTRPGVRGLCVRLFWCFSFVHGWGIWSGKGLYCSKTSDL